jgi:hypothetical protein
MRLFLVCSALQEVDNSSFQETYEVCAQKIATELNKKPTDMGSLLNNPMADMLMKGMMGAMKNVAKDTNMAIPKFKARIWNAPDKQSRDIADIIEGITRSNVHGIREDILLSDRIDQYTADSFTKKWMYADTEIRDSYKESYFDVSCRLRLFFNTLRQDRDDENVNDAIIIAKSDILNLIKMLWLNRTQESFLSSKKMEQGSVYVLENSNDLGLL